MPEIRSEIMTRFISEPNEARGADVSGVRVWVPPHCGGSLMKIKRPQTCSCVNADLYHPSCKRMSDIMSLV